MVAMIKAWGVLVLVTVSMAGCAKTVQQDTTGLPDKSTTECQRLESSDLGGAESAFSCRGGIFEVGGGLFATAKGSKQGVFTLFGISEKGVAEARVETEHSGDRVILVETRGGLLAVSAKGASLKVSAHASSLAGEAVTLDLRVDKGKILDFVAVSFSGPKDRENAAAGGAIIAASTGHGVWMYLVGPGGELVETRMVLEHPEMGYCRKLGLEPVADGGYALALRCQEVVPRAPEMIKHRAVVSEFDYDATEPPSTDLSVLLDSAALPTSTGAQASAEEGEPVGYQTRQYLKEQLPRPAEHRVHILEGLMLKERDYLALSCQGPDDGPVSINLSRVTCDRW